MWSISHEAPCYIVPSQSPPASSLRLHSDNISEVQLRTHLSFTFPVSAQWCSVSALSDIGHAICSRESLMIMSHAKCGAGGSDTRSERCRRPRLRVIARPVSLGVHPSMVITTITEIKLTITHDAHAVFLWQNQSLSSHGIFYFKFDVFRILSWTFKFMSLSCILIVFSIFSVYWTSLLLYISQG